MASGRDFLSERVRARRARRRRKGVGRLLAGYAVSAATDPTRAGRYDAGVRRASVRRGRERGCWVYVPVSELVAAGMAEGGPPYYRTTGRPHSRNTGTVLVRLYREP